MTQATTPGKDLPAREVWRDQRAPVPERVADMMGRMTTREKVGQLYGLWLGAADANGEVAPYQSDMGSVGKNWKELAADGVGQLTRPYGTAPVEPLAGAVGLWRGHRSRS